MERLTHQLKTREVVMATEYDGKYTKNEWICVLQERLAAYEDTGLTPDEIMAMQRTLDEYHKSADPLLKAQANDRVEVLPCKVGDTVYAIFAGEIVEHLISKVIINGSTNPQIWVERYCPFMMITPKRWDLAVGKDFYLTREEAEEALRRFENEHTK